MIRLWAFVVVLHITLATAGYAQTSEPPLESSKVETEGKTTAEADAQELPSPFALQTFSGGDLWSRSHLTGDWNGTRSELAENGITFDIGVTQIFQVNARGGVSTNNGFRYGGSADFTLTLDSARMGLWPAGQLVIKGETQFGNSVNGKVGSVMAPNADALFPLPDEHKTTLTDVVYTQFFSEHFGISLGKIDFRAGACLATGESASPVASPGQETGVTSSCRAVP